MFIVGLKAINNTSTGIEKYTNIFIGNHVIIQHNNSIMVHLSNSELFRLDNEVGYSGPEIG
jgi:hypothetical protein